MKRFPYQSNRHDDCKYCDIIGYILFGVIIIVFGLLAGGTL